jgi:hypothetical protein
VIVGTPAYLAPEQAHGKPIDARCDLFSLGVILYRLCTGRQPFQGRDAVATLLEVVTHQPDPPMALNPQVPAELSDLVMRLLEKAPDRRPESAGAVVQALQTIEKGVTRHKDPRQEPTPRLAAGRGVRGGLWPVVIAAVLLIGLGALAVIRITTDQGTYVIETDDPEFAFQVKDGGVTLEDRKTNHKYTLKVLRQAKGEFELEVVEPTPDITFKDKIFTIKRGEKAVARAWFERKATEALPDDPWLKQVAGLPPEKRVQVVLVRLKEHNPDFDGTETHTCEGNAVRSLTLKGPVPDLTPLRALPELRELMVSASRLSDLTPLKGMKLETLAFQDSQVSDLTPLKGMPLTTLDCSDSLVSDLSPIQDMKLTLLWCNKTKVTDLTPLRNMPLVELRCNFRPDRDVEILRSIKSLERINKKPAKEFLKDFD